MRIERAIDAFLDWRQLERDATPRSIDSYRRILWKLAFDFPEARVEELTTQDLRLFLGRWRDRSATTRANVVSVLHSFFSWAEAEEMIDRDPARKIRRPPKRKPDLYRPSVEELERLRAAAFPHERPAILLMEGAGRDAPRWLVADGPISILTAAGHAFIERVSTGNGCRWIPTW